MEMGKTYWGIEQTGEKERQKEKGLERERERCGIGRKRKVRWVILTIG